MFRRMGCLSTFLIYCRYDHIRLVATSFNCFFWGCSKFQQGWSMLKWQDSLQKAKKWSTFFFTPIWKQVSSGSPTMTGPSCHLFSMSLQVPPKKWKSWTAGNYGGTWRNHHELHILEQLFYLLGVHYIHRLCMWHVNVLSPYPFLALAPRRPSL